MKRGSSRGLARQEPRQSRRRWQARRKQPSLVRGAGPAIHGRALRASPFAPGKTLSTSGAPGRDWALPRPRGCPPQSDLLGSGAQSGSRVKDALRVTPW
jgi:hypothetical protein